MIVILIDLVYTEHIHILNPMIHSVKSDFVHTKVK